jgi:hypothetical protein
MNYRFFLFCIVIIVLLVSGCLAEFGGNEQVVRTYTHNTSTNLTINIYKEDNHNLMILESNSSDILVVESFYLKKSYVKDSNMFITDYVKFNGNSTDLTLNISTLCPIDPFEIRDANVHINISIPTNTNYTINKVYSRFFKDI